MSASSQNLVWIDLEMTGLNCEKDVILEIATIVTDSNLVPFHEGLSLVIHQSDAVLVGMDSWCQVQHKKSGLTEEVRNSLLSLAEAEEQTREYIGRWCVPQTAPLCGNTIFQDRSFLRRYMSLLDAILHYRMVDVSSVKELVRRWYPQNPAAAFSKQDRHRALIDINESIAELQHYRTYFFQE